MCGAALPYHVTFHGFSVPMRTGGALGRYLVNVTWESNLWPKNVTWESTLGHINNVTWECALGHMNNVTCEITHEIEFPTLRFRCALWSRVLQVH